MVENNAGGADTHPDNEDFHRDPPQAEQELAMSKDISAMPEEVRDRFKALKVLYDRCGDCDEVEEKEYREFERKYEKMYAEIYVRRAQYIKGEKEVPAEVVEQYAFREANLKDEAFNALEVEVCDVKSI